MIQILHVREKHPKEHKDQNVMWGEIIWGESGPGYQVAYVVMDHTSIVLSCSKAIIIMTNYYCTEPI